MATAAKVQAKEGTVAAAMEVVMVAIVAATDVDMAAMVTRILSRTRPRPRESFPKELVKLVLVLFLAVLCREDEQRFGRQHLR